MIGLEQTFFTVSEDIGVAEICAVVFLPDITCPVEFPFEILLQTASRTAGRV